MATKNRERKDTQTLVETGKSKGYLTYDEVNDALPADAVADQMDDVMSVLQLARLIRDRLELGHCCLRRSRRI